MLVHLLPAGEYPSSRDDQRGVEAEKSVGQESVGPQRALPRDPGLRRPYAGRLVPIRQPRGTPADRCATYLPQGRPPVAGQKLWRITCFFVDPKYRGRGVAKFALRAALDSIGNKGGGVVEAYPVASPKMAAVPEWRWFGTPGMFRKEGFRTVAPLGTSGVLMRKTIAPRRAKKP